MSPGREREFDYPEMLGFFRNRLPIGVPEDAEDLCQETLMASMRAPGRKAGAVCRPGHYVRGIAVNKLRDVLRRKYRRISVPFDSGNASVYSLPSPGLSPEARIIHDESRRELLGALGHLEAMERRLLQMIYYSELSHRDACARLGLSPAAGSRLKYRALRKLRRRIGAAHALQRSLPGATTAVC